MNIRTTLKELGVPFVEHGQSGLVTDGWVGTPCPYCDNGRKNPGLGIHLRTLRANCWKCGGLSLVRALADITEKPAGFIRQLLGGLTPEPVKEEPKGKLTVPPGVGPLLGPHRAYLAKRGFDPDQLVAEWGIGALGPLAGRLAWRIYIPIFDVSGTQVSWTTRAIGAVPHGERYRGASKLESSVPRGEVLYGAHRARHAVIAVEGPFGVFWGGPGFICTAGIGFSRPQVLQLSRYPVRAILFDREPSAQRRAHALATQLECFPGETYILQTSGGDPDTSPRAEAEEIRSRFLE